jgi:hypothetical protein
MRYFLLILFCFSCGGDDFTKVERLENFRVLGIIANSPEVSEGATVTVNALISDLKGASAIIDGDFERCIDPGIARGASVSCDLDPTKVSGNYDIPTGGFTNRTGIGPNLTFTIPSVLTGRSSADRLNGVGYIVIFNFSVDGKVHRAFKRILVSERTIKNTNPQIDSILLNGSAIGAAPLDGDRLSLATVSGAESYDVITADGNLETRTEIFEVAWYTSLGKFDKPKASSDERVKFQGDQPDFILAVIRDERGGIDFATYP